MSDLIKAADELAKVVGPLICDALPEAEFHEKHFRENGSHHELDQAESNANSWRSVQEALTAYRKARESAGEVSKCGCGGNKVWDGVCRTSMPPCYAHTCDKCRNVTYETRIRSALAE